MKKNISNLDIEIISPFNNLLFNEVIMLGYYNSINLNILQIHNLTYYDFALQIKKLIKKIWNFLKKLIKVIYII